MSDMQNLGVPWADLDISADLDILYYSHSANKIISPIVWDFIKAGEQSDNSLSSSYRATLARMIVIKYNDKWSRLWDLGEAEYNPLYSDQMTENETINQTHTVSGTNTGTVVTDHDRTETGTVTDAGTEQSTDGVWGFNSSTAVNTDTTNGTVGNTRTDNLSKADDITETRNLADSETGSNASARNLTRQGRTGSMVSGTRVQDLIEAEREVLQWNFWNVVFSDIDTVLALDIY